MAQQKVFRVEDVESLSVQKFIDRLRRSRDQNSVTHVYLGDRLCAIDPAIELLASLDQDVEVQLSPTFSVTLPGGGQAPAPRLPLRVFWRP